jgi:hypothetical protein
MQNYCRIFDGESWIEARKRHFIEIRLLHQRNNDATPVAVEDGRLHNDHIGNRISIRASIAMDVELSRLQVGMFVRVRVPSCSLLRHKISQQGLHHLGEVVRHIASLSKPKSSFRDRFTGRFGALAL